MIRLIVVSALFTAAAPEILAQSAAPAVYRVSSEYAYFRAPQKPMPTYPSDTFINKIGGDVILHVKYSTEGLVEAVEALTAESELITAAAEAVKNWKFRPVEQKGTKVEAVTCVGFHYVASTDTVFSSLPFGNWAHGPVPPFAADTPPKPRRVRISSAVAAGNRISGSNPLYPYSAKHDRIQGDVEPRTIIDRRGEIKVIHAPSQDLAISAMRQ